VTRQKVDKTAKLEYNVRIVDNGDGTFQLGPVSRLRSFIGGGGEWISGSQRKMLRLLKGKCEIIS